MSGALIISGNPADGFVFVGPFEDREEAIQWAEEARYANAHESWWVADLLEPGARYS